MLSGAPNAATYRQSREQLLALSDYCIQRPEGLPN